MSTRPDPLDEVDPDPVDLPTAAAAFGISRAELRSWIREGLVPEPEPGLHELDRLAIAILSRPAAVLRGDSRG
ncbi:MAG: hypothetical protein OJJ54_24980 [Pseudonocardia sp.]|nr:hypothetical protein [Pseudonocardia sp.]